MRKSIYALCALILAIVAGYLVSCTGGDGKEKQSDRDAAPDSMQLVKRGAYLVNAMGCDDCHSPKRMGPHGPEIIPELRFSGYPSDRPRIEPDASALSKGWTLFGPDLTTAAGPWGQSFAANISSDGTGIGNWSEEHFFTAIRDGKSKGIASNRDLLPPMPWFMYRNLTEEDLRGIFYYLKTSAPVKNIVPDPIPPAGSR